MAKKKATKEVKKEVDLAAEIKKMEEAKRKAAPVLKNKVVSYNSWYHQRKHKIPKQHVKEVIWADFVARGVKDLATVEEFDKALELYGVKL